MFKTHEGRPGVSNSFHITNLLINEDIPDINTFKKNLLAIIGNDASPSSRKTSPTMKKSLYDDFVTGTEFKNIAELDKIKEENTVIVLGTIMPISRHTKWYYDACKICNKQVIEILTDDDETVDGDGQNGQKVYECPKCKKQVTEFSTRYKIPLNVEDSTGVVSLILWDWEANKILKKSAKALVMLIWTYFLMISRTWRIRNLLSRLTSQTTT
ncbi:putative nucleic acid-binding, replication factor A [Helianthus debilis subsp. tardiflorus]